MKWWTLVVEYAYGFGDTETVVWHKEAPTAREAIEAVEQNRNAYVTVLFEGKHDLKLVRRY